jgi:long-subunit fatty acid transport protein
LTGAVLNATGGDIVGVIPDINVDSKRTGSAITPIFSVFLSPGDMIGFSFRYEPLTKLKLTAETKEDGTIVLGEPGMFPDGAEYNEDLPPQISFGLNLKPSERLMIATSFDYWQNEKVNRDGWEANVTNNWEAGASVEYGLSDALSISLGYLRATTGANEFYQTDLSYSLNTNTVAGGFKYVLNPTTALNFGVSNTFYEEGNNEDVGTIYAERYNKTAFVIAFGLSKSF